MTAKPVQRIRSTRAYRRILDELIQQARRGEIPWREVNNAASAVKVAAEALMAENLMKDAGISDAENTDDHVLGTDGGLEDFAPHKKGRVYRKKTKVRKTGVSAKGIPIDETTNKVER